MIPINSRTLKEEEESRSKIGREDEGRNGGESRGRDGGGLGDLFPHSQNHMDSYMEGYYKNQYEGQDPHNFMAYHHEEYQNPDNPYMFESYFEPNYHHLKNNWFINNGEYDYPMKVKREEENEQRFWHSQIKDEESPSLNHHDFQPCDIPKCEEPDISRCIFEDPNKFLGFLPSKEEKNSCRKMKVQAYLKKKKMRSFKKKIIYKCRKEVADNRVRFRGRFISLLQAVEILGLDPKVTYTPLELSERIKIIGQSDNPKNRETPVKSQPTNIGEKSE